MHGITTVNVCDVGTTHCMSSATADAAVSSGTSAASTAVELHDITCNMTDNRDPAVLVIDNGSKNIASATSANVNKHTGDEVCNSIDTTCRQSSASLDILRMPVDAVSLVTDGANSVSSSVSESTTTESSFHFSVAGYDFQKYTDMVIVSQ